MATRRKYLHIHKIIWTTSQIGLSDRNLAKLRNGEFAGIKIDQKLAGKTMYPGVFKTPTKPVSEQMWKGVKLHIYNISELERINEKEKVYANK